jgi:hypothetical protein
MIDYKFFMKNTKLFSSIFGLNIREFEVLVTKVERLFNKKVIKKYKRPGRSYKLDMKSMVMILLMYYRHYVTQRFIGVMFGLDVANVCRIIRKLEPILSQIMKLPNRTGLQPDELRSLIIIDATENQIERPKKNQKPYYSGKKKKHTIKTEIRVTKKGEIVHVSESVPGAVHDFDLLKKGEKIPKGSRVYVDSGYQGIQNIHKESEYPYKKPRKGELSSEEKEYNTALSRVRVKVENVLARIKVFKIMAHRYRNKREMFNEKFRIVAGIVNLKSGFGFA